MLTNRIQALKPSLTIAISNKAKALKAQGKDILSFSAGEPDFDTPSCVKNAAIKAIEEGKSKYTAVSGIDELLEAIAYKLEKENSLKYKKEQILTNSGAKQSLFNITQALLEKGDEVIIPSPYWVTYPELVRYADASPVMIECKRENNFKITPEELQNAITPRTKMLMLNSPNNPTGAIYTREELLKIGEVLKSTKIIVVSDEIYEKLSYDMEFTSTASVSEDMFKRTITVNGLSKCAAMPGWRFGYLATADTNIANAIKKLQSQSASNICSIVQYASIVALLGEADKDIAYMKEAFTKRRDLATKLINDIQKLSVSSPAGAFYLFIDISKTGLNSMDFCEQLLDKKGVALVPGIGFGMEGFVRFSYATNEENITKGIARIAEFLA